MNTIMALLPSTMTLFPFYKTAKSNTLRKILANQDTNVSPDRRTTAPGSQKISKVAEQDLVLIRGCHRVRRGNVNF